MSSGLAAFPATLQSGTVVGRLAIGPGPAEALSLAALFAQNGATILVSTTTTGTNTLLATTLPAPVLASGQVLFLIPAATNTGAVTLNRDATGVKAVLQNGLALIGGELKINVPVLFFYDGTQYNLIGQVFTSFVKRKTADQSVTSSTVLINDNDLLFPIAALEEWVATFSIDAGAAIQANTGIQVAITVPSGATLNAYAALLGTSGTTATPGGGRSSTSGTAILNFASGAGVATANQAVELRVWVLNGANAGTVNLQWAQGTSNGTALTFRKGSFMQATRIA